jgi:hypothetical protein
MEGCITLRDQILNASQIRYDIPEMKSLEITPKLQQLLLLCFNRRWVCDKSGSLVELSPNCRNIVPFGGYHVFGSGKTIALNFESY